MPPLSRILIVEDEELLAQNLCEFLSRHATEVRVAHDGIHAIEVVDEFEPEVIVMDYHLPGMDGLQAFAEIRRRSDNAKCVMITGHANESLEHTAHANGIDRVLLKPFSFAQLGQMITETIELGSRGEVLLDDRRGPADRRGFERRGNAPAAVFPLVLPAGTVEHERRMAERRRSPDRRTFDWQLTGGHA